MIGAILVLIAMGYMAGYEFGYHRACKDYGVTPLNK
jgi:hypothetical protein